LLLLGVVRYAGLTIWAGSDNGQLLTDGTPFPFAERVESISLAQQRVQFVIPLPSVPSAEWEASAIWVPQVDKASEFNRVWIVFRNGITASVQGDIEPPDGDRLERLMHSGFAPADIGDYIGRGKDAGVSVTRRYGEVQTPSVIAWWQAGTQVVLYSNEHSLGELAEIAGLFVR